jgi:Fe-S-cluster containining protein
MDNKRETVEVGEYEDEAHFKEPAEDPEEFAREKAISLLEEDKQTIQGISCTKCGACCCPPGKEAYPYVELLHSDVVKLGLHASQFMKPKMGSSPNTSGLFLEAIPDTSATGFTYRERNLRCPFFNGEVGASCECGIYGIRPKACQDHQPGDRFCLDLRAQHPLTNPHLRKHYRMNYEREEDKLRLMVIDLEGRAEDVTEDVLGQLVASQGGNGEST